MKHQKTTLDRVYLFNPEIQEDFRGQYVETYNERDYQNVANVHFVQDDISVSSKGVLRGIHGDETTWKLIQCLRGRIYFVVVDCDHLSSNFGKWQSFILSEHNRHQVLVPPRFGNAHLALTDEVIFSYKQSTYYEPGTQFSYRYDDKRFNIGWPMIPILSQRDEGC